MEQNIGCEKFCNGSEFLGMNLKCCVHKCPRTIRYDLFQILCCKNRAFWNEII
jgi:hypothetical protein